MAAAVPALYMSGKRYQDLLRQVNGQLALYKSQPKHTRTDPGQVHLRLKVGPGDRRGGGRTGGSR